MKNFAYWGRGSILLAILFIFCAPRILICFSLRHGYGAFFIYRYHIIPIFMGVGIAGLTGRLAWLVAEHLFKQHMRLFPRFQRFKANQTLPDQTEEWRKHSLAPPKGAVLAFSFIWGQGGNCGGRLIFWGGASFPRGRGHIKTAPLGGRLGFSKTSQAKAFPHVGAGEGFPIPAQGLGTGQKA